MVRVFVVYERGAGRRALRAPRRALPGPSRAGRSGTGRSSARRWASRRYAYYAEWEFADLDAFKAAARTEEFMATGKDAMDMGVPFHVHFANVE